MKITRGAPESQDSKAKYKEIPNRITRGAPGLHYSKANTKEILIKSPAERRILDYESLEIQK